MPVAGKISARMRNYLALALVSVSLFASIALIPVLRAGAVVRVSIPLPILGSMSFTADGLAVFMALVSSLIGAVIIIYSFDYISVYPNQSEYYTMVALFLGSMMGLVYSSNLILLYVFWELTAVASWRLIGFFREQQHVIRADKALLVTVFGALAMLLGFIMLYGYAGSFELQAVKLFFAGENVPAAAAALILIGILSKSATLPFHTWLPDAGVAPSPVTALLHAAVLVKIGTYVFARLFIATFALNEAMHTAVLWIASASALVAAGAALRETDIKRVIAYSTVSQIAFIFLGFAVNNAVGIAGALLYILTHGLAKGGLFLSAGIVEHNTHNKDITKMGGLARTMPVTAVSFAACSLSVMGVPPLGGFWSKYMVFSGSAASGRTAITSVFLVGAVLTVMYLARLFMMVFLGEEKGNTASEGSGAMVISVFLLAALSLLFGVYINYPSAMAQAVVRNILGA